MNILPRNVITLSPLVIAALGGFTVIAAQAADTAPSPVVASIAQPNCAQMSVGSRPNPGGKGSAPITVACTAETMKNNPQCAAVCADNTTQSLKPKPSVPFRIPGK